MLFLTISRLLFWGLIYFSNPKTDSFEVKPKSNCQNFLRAASNETIKPAMVKFYCISIFNVRDVRKLEWTKNYRKLIKRNIFASSRNAQRKGTKFSYYLQQFKAFFIHSCKNNGNKNFCSAKFITVQPQFLLSFLYLFDNDFVQTFFLLQVCSKKANNIFAANSFYCFCGESWVVLSMVEFLMLWL